MGRGRMRRGRDCGERGVRQEGAAARPVRANTGGAGPRGGQARRRRRLHHPHPSRPERRRLEAGRRAPRRGVRVHGHHPATAGAGDRAGDADRDGADCRGPGRRCAGGAAAADWRSRRTPPLPAPPSRCTSVLGPDAFVPKALPAPPRPDPAAGDGAGAARDAWRAAPVLHRGGLQRSRPPGPAEPAGGTAAHRSARRAGGHRDRAIRPTRSRCRGNPRAGCSASCSSTTRCRSRRSTRAAKRRRPVRRCRRGRRATTSTVTWRRIRWCCRPRRRSRPLARWWCRGP